MMVTIKELNLFFVVKTDKGLYRVGRVGRRGTRQEVWLSSTPAHLSLYVLVLLELEGLPTLVCQ